MKSVTQVEFDALIADRTKRIEGPIAWIPDQSGTVFEFRVKVISAGGDQLTIKGSHNRKLGKTTYTLFSTDRIFGADYDRKHGDAGSFHVHRWDANRQTSTATKADAGIEIGKDPLRLWKWFCEQAHIKHEGGALAPLPPVQRSLFGGTN